MQLGDAMHQIRDTSLKAYSHLVESGAAMRQEDLIMLVVSKHFGDMTRREIGDVTGLAANAVSGRVNTLLHLGKLVETERRKCSISGRTVIPVAPAHA